MDVTGIFSDETFILNPGGVAVEMDHLGMWFADPEQAVKAGCPGKVSPFDGDHNAGIQVLNTVVKDGLSESHSTETTRFEAGRFVTRLSPTNRAGGGIIPDILASYVSYDRTPGYFPSVHDLARGTKNKNVY
jgi:hypothetical protein